jgi:hypothetical protein
MAMSNDNQSDHKEFIPVSMTSKSAANIPVM